MYYYWIIIIIIIGSTLSVYYWPFKRNRGVIDELQKLVLYCKYSWHLVLVFDPTKLNEIKNSRIKQCET